MLKLHESAVSPMHKLELDYLVCLSWIEYFEHLTKLYAFHIWCTKPSKSCAYLSAFVLHLDEERGGMVC